jgi:hypothetical protein
MRRLVLIVSCLLAFPLSGWTQDQKPEQSWDNLRTLRAGEKIQVVDQKLKSQNGTFVAFSDDAITFRPGKDEVTVQHADVFRVTSREHHKRRRNTLIGLAAGAGAGAVVGCANSGWESGEKCMWALPFALGVGGIGAGIGAALPAGNPTIYRAERRKDQTAP